MFAPTPYPYPPSCGFVEDEMTYALQVAKDNAGDVYNNPRYGQLFPIWSNLLQKYIQDQNDSLANPTDTGLKNKAMMSKMAMMQFENANNFHPYADQPLMPEAPAMPTAPSSTESFINHKWRPFKNPNRTNRFKNPNRTNRFSNKEGFGNGLDNPNNSTNPGIIAGQVATYSPYVFNDGQASQKQSLGVNDAAPLSDTGLMFSSSGGMYSEPCAQVG